MDLIIFSGQSNMQGQSERLSEDAVVEGAFEYRFLTDSLVDLKNPVGENITCDFKEGIVPQKETLQREWLQAHLAGSACYNHTNLVPAFCRAFIEKTGKAVAVAHIAKGSTQIKDWLLGSDGYEILLKKGRAAKEKVCPARIFFVWLQGESDAIFGKSKEEYKSCLFELKEALKKDLEIEKFGIIKVGRFTGDHRDDEIISAQEELCREQEDFLMLTELAETMHLQPEYMNPFVGGHFSALGLEVLGAVAGAALADYLNQ